MILEYNNIIKNDMEAKEIIDIIKIISGSKAKYFQMADEANFRFHNGRHTTVWDIIFTDIENAFDKKDGYRCYAVKRCELWEFSVIYKEDIDTVYLVFKEKRFKELKKDSGMGHYARTFNSKNHYKLAYVDTGIQTSFFPGDEQFAASQEYINDDLEKMIGEIKDKVKNCVNILFREGPHGLTSITANIANQDLDIVATKDWSNYITADIDQIIDTKIVAVNDGNKEIPLTLKADKVAQRRAEKEAEHIEKENLVKAKKEYEKKDSDN